MMGSYPQEEDTLGNGHVAVSQKSQHDKEETHDMSYCALGS